MKKQKYRLNAVGIILRLCACFLYSFFISAQVGLVILIEILTKNEYVDGHKWLCTFLVIVFAAIPFTAIWYNISLQDIDSWIVRKFGHKVVKNSANN